MGRCGYLNGKVAQEFTGKKGKEFYSWAKKNNVVTDGDKNYEIDDVELKLDFPSIKQLMEVHGENWRAYYPQKRHNFRIEQLRVEDIILKPVGNGLVVKPNASPDRVSIRVFCKKCRDIIVTTGGVVRRECDHSSEQTYQARFNVEGLGLFTKGGGEKKDAISYLSARIWDAAVEEAKSKYAELSGTKSEITYAVNAKPNDSLTVFMDKYLSFLNGELADNNISYLRIKKRSKHHVGDVKNHLQKFLFGALEERELSPEYCRAIEVNIEKENWVYQLVEEATYCRWRREGDKPYHPRTQNKILEHIKYFFQWIHATYPLTFRNMPVPFSTFTKSNSKFEEPENQFEQRELSTDEFSSILEAMTEENLLRQMEIMGRKVISIGDLQWLKHVYHLELYTGRRREDLVRLKWKDVSEDRQSEKMFVHIINYKKSRLRQRGGKETWSFIPFFCHKKLKELLIELGYGKNNPEDYIIYNEGEQMQDHANGLRKHKSISRGYMISKTSIAFTFFAKLAGVDATNKALKKTFITDTALHVGGDYSGVLGGSLEVLKNHYENRKRVMAEQMKDFEPFKKRN